MIPIKEAIASAYKFLEEIPWEEDYKKSASIEEIEYGSEGEHSVWKITLGFRKPTLLALMVSSQKEYRIFNVRSDIGTVLSMKIRE